MTWEVGCYKDTGGEGMATIAEQEDVLFRIP